jgi:hypothetical protein
LGCRGSLCAVLMDMLKPIMKFWINTTLKCFTFDLASSKPFIILVSTANQLGSSEKMEKESNGSCIYKRIN